MRVLRGIADGQHGRTTGAVNNLHGQRRAGAVAERRDGQDCGGNSRELPAPMSASAPPPNARPAFNETAAAQLWTRSMAARNSACPNALKA